MANNYHIKIKSQLNYHNPLHKIAFHTFSKNQLLRKLGKINSWLFLFNIKKIVITHARKVSTYGIKAQISQIVFRNDLQSN
jgi:hypothetical protein